MERVRESWTDERLDDLNRRVDVGFRESRDEIRALRGEMNTRFGEMNARFDSMESRFDSMASRFDAMESRFDAMQRTMLHGFIAISAAMLTAFGGFAALIATQL